MTGNKQATGAKSETMASNKTTTEKGMVKMANISMEELVKNITAAVMANMVNVNQMKVTKMETPKKANKKSTKKEVKEVKLNPVQLAITKKQEELVVKFGKKDYVIDQSDGFHTFYKLSDKGSYVKIGHYNVTKKLFWFESKRTSYGDWLFISKLFSEYAESLEIKARLSKAGIKTAGDFKKMSWARFMTPGAFMKEATC